jgi:clathrin heavy chain
MESDKYICVRESIGNSGQLLVIDMQNNPISESISKHQISADSVIMNPSKKIIALRGYSSKSKSKKLFILILFIYKCIALRMIQIYDIENKSKLKFHTMNDDILFWRWINDKIIGLVTISAVFHWCIKGDTIPIKIFDRHKSLNSYTIVDYRTDQSLKWLVLIGSYNQVLLIFC